MFYQNVNFWGGKEAVLVSRDYMQVRMDPTNYILKFA
jgi:hypothetical protein